MSQTLITSRDPKGLQIASLFDVALNKVKLDHEHAQRLIENGGDFQDAIAQLIGQFSATDQYAEEEMESDYGYLSGYGQPKPLDQQVKLASGNVIDMKTLLAVGIAGFTIFEVGASAATPVWVTLSVFALNHMIQSSMSEQEKEEEAEEEEEEALATA